MNTLKQTKKIIISLVSIFGLLVLGLLAGALMASVADAKDLNKASQENEPLALETKILKEISDPRERRLVAVEAYLNEIQTLSARFTQQSPTGALSRGKLHMERPGKIRFEYDGDVPLLIVGDGKNLNLIDYEMNEITRWPVNDTPLAFLVSKRVDFTKSKVTLNYTGPESVANMISVTAQNPKKPEQGSLTLMFEANAAGADEPLKLTLRAWQVIDAQGSRTTVSLTALDINAPLTQTLWTFKDPRGKRATRRRSR